MRVLICDDEPSIRLLFRTAIEHLGMEVIEAVNGEECLAEVTRGAPDAIILDVFMPGIDGLAVLPQLLLLCPDAPVFVVSAHATRETYEQALAWGATACFEKLSFLERIPDLFVGRGSSV